MKTKELVMQECSRCARVCVESAMTRSDSESLCVACELGNVAIAPHSSIGIIVEAPEIERTDTKVAFNIAARGVQIGFRFDGNARRVDFSTVHFARGAAK